jgi:hypothetical protein
MQRSCDYSEIPEQPGPDDFAALRHKIAELEARLDQGSQSSTSAPSAAGSESVFGGSNVSSLTKTESFPAAFFLDSDVFQDTNMVVPKVHFPIPEQITATIASSILDIEDLVDRYSASVHTWLPFVSMKRLKIALSNPEFVLSSDLALLLLSMKLVLEVPQCAQSARSPLYDLTKNYARAAEDRALLSVPMIQANILTAVYEIAHGIYPAAYMSTGHCARLGHAFGLHDAPHALQLVPNNRSAWAKFEERKRVWWAILLIDR